MYLEPGKIPSVDNWAVDYVHAYYKDHIKKQLITHNSKSHQFFVDPDHWKQFMLSRTKLMAYFEENTYPFGEPVRALWMKYYSADMKDENGFGGFLGLHQDHFNFPDKTDQIVFVNSILIDQSNDMAGGEVVLAGDSYDTHDPKKRPIDTRDIMHRLKVVRQEKPGDVIWWNGFTLHGIGQIKKGNRLTLMVVKFIDWDDRYFDRRKFSDPYYE